MMEVDHVTYIFGSFTRRRQSQNMSSPKRRTTIDQPPASPTSTISQPYLPANHNDVISHRATKSYGDIPDKQRLHICTLCRRQFTEPRVLPCLHTFCTRCLLEIETTNDEFWDQYSDVSENKVDSHRSLNGFGSSCDSEVLSEERWLRRRPKIGTMSCPQCEETVVLPLGGVLGLPPHYTLQHRLVLSSLNKDHTKLLCDFCPSEIAANSRCTDCLVSLCVLCAHTHQIQRPTSSHQILSLQEARRTGMMKIRRQAMCPTHSEEELTAFCVTCCQVACRLCCSSQHLGHTCEPVSRVASSYISNIKKSLHQARLTMEQTAAATLRHQATSRRIDLKCSQVKGEVERFITAYVHAVEEHGRNLLLQIRKIRNEKLQALAAHQEMLAKKINETSDTIQFVDELLKEGLDVEVLSFVKPVVKKLERCSSEIEEPMVPEGLQFLSDEELQVSGTGPLLYGAVTTQTVSPDHCILHNKGLDNLKVHRRAEVVLETRDKSNCPLNHGGEKVMAEVRYKDAGSCRSVPVNVTDRRDGTYVLSFVPEAAGTLSLSVTVRGHSIKDSPFPLAVRLLKQHHGLYHCCSFCSSGGSKDVTCGCGGTMPGGYKGCGHGHEGHPGRRHWSCCGNVIEHSECIRATSTLYQFTL